MIVTDASVIIKYIMREPGWETARDVFTEGAITVELAIKETMNALWRMILMNKINTSNALKILMALYSLVDVVDQRPYYEKALEIAVEKRITIYDAIYIALAKQLGVKLATADRSQANAAREMNIDVVLI